ncbi:MAG: hypothetical protein FJX25_02055 [Alphaproteobacteria bacterium]|nr:hypothetical protein [Alphaproteobacteria bacterium]
MYQHQAALRPSVLAKDLELILSAIGAYSHNTEYRDLLDRLKHQVDVLVPAKFLDQIKTNKPVRNLQA